MKDRAELQWISVARAAAETGVPLEVIGQALVAGQVASRYADGRTAVRLADVQKLANRLRR